MDFPKDDFKGFGEGFSGFPKRLPEDCVEYTLFIIDSKLKSQKELLAQLEIIRKESIKLTESLCKEYIWQRENFKLDLESSKGSMHLHGVTNYGDSVEDEWLIVYILKELSNRYPNIWIKVVDTDGEFLLIEAANALPRWLNPEIADNRVWIHQNKLRIIPLTAATPSTTAKATKPISHSLTLDEALTTLTNTPEIPIHSPLIEAEAFYRLRNYPSQILNSMHHAPITIPRKLAYMLHTLPSSIAPATEAFYLRDPIALKLLQAPSSELAFPPTDLVTVSTRFTRILYAQLKSQEFPPPSSWKDHLASRKPDDLNPKALEQLELGIKVTSGFEMLVQDPSNKDHRVARELNILLDDLATDPSLTLPTDAEIAAWKDVSRADSETWLDINFADFEAELDGKSRSKGKGSVLKESMSGFGDAKTQADLKKMVERFEAFLNDDDAGIDGAKMDDMDIDDDGDDDDDEDDDSEEDSEDEDKDVSFDEKEFARMMREMMGLPSEEAEDDAGATSSSTSKLRQIEEVDSDLEDERDASVDEDAEMRKVMALMDAELKEAGALDLEPPTSKSAPKALKANGDNKGKSNQAKNEQEDDDSSDEEDGELDIDFNLAKNLLESFKSQAGMAGPGGNLMGMMGMQLPRDEDDVKPAGGK